MTKERFPEEACGRVESTQQKKNGLVVVVKGSFSKGLPESKVRLTEKRTLPQYPMPGDSLCYEASWYPVNPPSIPGAFDTGKWLKSQNIAAYGKLKHWTVFGSRWVPERSFFRFRGWIRSRFTDYLDSAETGLLLGLLAGERSGIPDALRSDFQRSGLVHVLAISGFHVVLLAGMLMVFLKATGLPHRIVRIAAVILLLLYVPVTGGSPAVRRAVLMFAVPQVGTLFQRPANTLNSLGVALLLIMLPEPSVIWNPGFQLSVAATMGILIGGPLNPLKKAQTDLLSDELRLEMTRLALENEPQMIAQDFEFHLPKPSYTWLTLQAMSAQYPDRQFILIIGGDNWQIFPRWYHSQDILDNYSLVIYPREGVDIDISTLPDNVKLLNAPLYQVSSTQIRQRIKEGKSVSRLIPKSIIPKALQYYR
jgi:nicotinate (nicotinamide) nucleotide adenylyltransferase